MMSNYKKRSFFFGSLLALFVMWGATGCIKENSSQCQTAYLLNVRAYASVGGSDASMDVEDVDLYIFDDDKLFVEHIATRIGESVPVSIPTGESITVIAWGNLSRGNQTCSQFESGDSYYDGCIDLMETRSDADATNVHSPGDLFHGALILTRDDMQTDKEIPLYRKTGSMNVTIRGLKQRWFADDDYYVKVHTSNRGIAFDGNHISGGEQTYAYLPSGAFNRQGEYMVPTFNLLANENITIDIYHGDVLLDTVDTLDGSTPIDIEEGKTTNLLISYLGSLNVTMEITNWGTETIWKNYN